MLPKYLKVAVDKKVFKTKVVEYNKWKYWSFEKYVRIILITVALPFHVIFCQQFAINL